MQEQSILNAYTDREYIDALKQEYFTLKAEANGGDFFWAVLDNPNKMEAERHQILCEIAIAELEQPTTTLITQIKPRKTPKIEPIKYTYDTSDIFSINSQDLQEFNEESDPTRSKPKELALHNDADMVTLTCMNCNTTKSVNLNLGYNLNNKWVGIRYICGCGKLVEMRDNQLKLEAK